MLILDAKRIQVLKSLIPENSSIAEVGVAKGTFSKQIVKHINPDELYLIDPWVYQDRDDYTMDGTNVPDAEGDIRYNHLLEHFAQPGDGKKVELFRGFSYDEVSRFDGNYLDAVYVDAMHTYEAAKQDLLDYEKVVKVDGLIAGHDFTNSMFAKRKNFGVVQAVSEFLNETGYAFLCVTNEAYPSYFIHKGAAESESYKTKKHSLIQRFNVYAEFTSGDVGRAQHNVVVKDNKITKSYFTLAA